MRIKQPSRYQQAIFTWMREGVGNSVIEAVAGSGKTSTIVDALEVLPPEARVLFLAFNKHIAEELKTRVPSNVQCATFHSLGLRVLNSAWRKVIVDDDKVRRIADKLVAAHSLPEELHGVVAGSLVRATSICMGTLTDPRDAAAVVETLDRYDIDCGEFLDIVLATLPAVFAACESGNTVCFDEMIYAPAVASFPMPRFEWILVDEGQDLNAAQIRFLLKLAAAGNARVVVVGDRHQSIYGFRGADFEALPNLIKALGATVLPLSITYRCPLSHVEMAQRLVPHLEPREGAPEGTVTYLSEAQALQQGVFTPGALVLCRTNAPLVSLAFSLLRSRVPVLVRGRDIGTSVAALVKRLWNGQASLPEFLERVSVYREREHEKLAARKASDAAVQALNDKIDTLYALADGCDSVKDILRVIEDLFRDTNEQGKVVLSSVHRAKGLEADRVIIIRPELLPMKARTPQGQQQEANIHYVALTRSRSELYFVASEAA